MCGLPSGRADPRHRRRGRRAHLGRQDPGHLLLTTYYLLRTTYYVLRTTYYVLRSTYYLLLTTYYLPLTTYYLLLTTYYLLATTLRPSFNDAAPAGSYGPLRRGSVAHGPMSTTPKRQLGASGEVMGRKWDTLRRSD